MRQVTCTNNDCANAGVAITLQDDVGAAVACGPCGAVLADQADWYTPPTLEETGFEPAPQRAAELIANMSETERQELAALIAPPSKPPTIGQVKK